jgi:hypothetical protein
MLRIMLAWAHLGTGVGFSLLTLPGQTVPHLECTWLQSIRTGLIGIEGRIKIFEPSVHKHCQVANTHIMDAICLGKQFNGTQI